MQPNADDLTALERQLTECRPAAAGLDADAMLFAAGRAAGLKSGGARSSWRVATFCLAVLCFGLGAALLGERSERLALADRLNRHADVASESPAPTTVPPPASPGADSYLASRRMIEDDSWLAAEGTGSGTPPVPPAEPQVLRAWPGVSAELPP